MKKMFSFLTISTRTWLFLVILCLTVVASIGSYVALTQIWSKQLSVFKQKYAAEQSQHLLYSLRERMQQNGTDRSDSIGIFEEASRHFAIPIQYVDADRETVILDLLDPVWLKRTDLFTVEAPLVLNGKIDGYLTSYFDTSDGTYSPAIRQFEEQIQRRSRFAITMLLCAAFAVSVFASWRWSRSLSTSSGMAESIVTSNQLSPIPVRGTTETRVLITTINHLIDRFERHESWRNQLMQDLTHELRTPLTAVLSQLDAIIDGIYPLTADQIQRILVDIERLYRLVEDMEKLSEAEGAQFELNKQEVNLSRVVQGIYEGFLFLTREKNIRFEYVPSKTPCYLQADPDRVAQILSNVMYNAIKYTPSGGKIEVGVVHEEDSMLVYCKDTGMGIPEEDLGRIFDRFYRADKSRSRDSGGLGVGLSIAKALVEAHQGKIWAESKLGKGSVFWIRLPVQQSFQMDSSRQALSAG
ncbi:HAMP domain-containing sensor histidine kinase [Paenibacillus sp. USDA918EY]|uniref:HAMP domain-containing sensor histidine kinase n=1 Tax=Paenibacillus sp. USDA918EY TaxID=2689575 RepID=UPI001F388177|nr:ATP-binding protein [Paenibacillus sp. USDA918EY]